MRKILLLFFSIFLLAACQKQDNTEIILKPEIVDEPDVVSEIISEVNFPSGGGTQSVSFTTNKPWEASFTSSQVDKSWFTISSQKGNAGSVNIVITTTENTGYDDRNMVLTIKTGNTIRNVNVTQKQKGAIIISKNNYEISEDGGSFDIEANTNVELEVSIPKDVDWVRTQVPTTRALSVKKIAFDVDKNSNPEVRNAKITIKDKNSNLSEIINVTQIARKEITRTVSVQTPGTLKEILGGDFLLVEKLTLSGNINGTDINVIREMAGSDRVGKPTAGLLYKLDLTNANIVEGGTPYYYSQQPNYTKNNILNDFTFYSCKSLKELILPKTITEIKPFAINNCENLESVKMYESVKYIRRTSLSLNRKLKNLNLSPAIEIIEEYAFANAAFESIILPKGIKFIAEGVFFACPNLKDIQFPGSITSINDNAFSLCKNLKTIILPNSVTIVGNSAFRECTNITSVTFGNKVTSIGISAFNDCNNISEIICKNPTPPAIRSTMLYVDPTFTRDVFKNAKVYIPKGYYEKYYTSQGWRLFDNLIEKDF